jgi:hypothetical protein
LVDEELHAFETIFTPLWAGRARSSSGRAEVVLTSDHSLAPLKRRVAESADQ